MQNFLQHCFLSVSSLSLNFPEKREKTESPSFTSFTCYALIINVRYNMQRCDIIWTLIPLRG